MRSVVVTGASTGIGWACAKVLIANGFHVFGSVRKQADAERLAQEFGASFTPLLFDVTDRAAVAEGARQVEAALAGETLAGLVNNAGIGIGGPLLYLKIADFERQLDVNLVGPLIVTQAFAPLLGAGAARRGPPGRIVMMSSVGGKNASPFFGPYATSKFGLEGLSEALRRELMLFGVDVIIIAPGPIATPIWDKAEAQDMSQFKDTAYAPALVHLEAFLGKLAKSSLPPERIGEAVRHALTAAKPKTRYTVTPTPVVEFLSTRLPKRRVDRLIARQLGWKA